MRSTIRMSCVSEDFTDKSQQSWMVDYHVYDGQHDAVDFHWSNHGPSLVVEELIRMKSL